MPPLPPARIRLDPQTRRAPRVVPLGQHRAPWEDLYHWMLTRPWWQFLGALALGFVTINALFAVVYHAVPGCVSKVADLEDAFWFSVETFSTVGYGTMAPASRYAHVVMAVEAFLGIVSTTFITGLTFAKFTRPTSRILFSRAMVVGERDGVPHLQVRMANWRQNFVVEATVRVVLLLNETTREGEVLRRQIELPLVRDRTAAFALSWLVMHEIDAASPLHGDARARLAAGQAELFVSVNGVDETFSATIHARHYYALDDIVWNARFADVLSRLPDGTRVVDYARFHEVIPVAPSELAK